MSSLSFNFVLLASSLLASSCLTCTSGARRGDPDMCRAFTEQCLPEICRQLKQHHWIDCDQNDMRRRVREKIRTCQDFDTCFNDLVSFNQITPANCRARPELCLMYACDRAKSVYSVRCDVANNRDRMHDLLRNCRAPTVEHCLSQIPTWSRGGNLNNNVNNNNNNRASLVAVVTPAECRKNPESCLLYACDRITKISQADCDYGNTKDRLKLMLKNCRAPQVDICLEQAANWQFDEMMPITPANCRSKPHKCISYACRYIESKNWVPCSTGNTVDRLIDLLSKCRAPKVDTCLDGVSSWPRPFEITPANCRRTPDSCLPYGCQFVESRNWISCSSGDTRSRLRTLFVNCRVPSVDTCLKEASKWNARVLPTRDVRIMAITPANCRSKPDDCITYGCQLIESRNWMHCSSGNTRQRLRTLFLNCRAPTVDACLNGASQWRPIFEITPANCRSQTENCMDYACNKAQQLHNKFCSDVNVRNIVTDMLKNCRAPRVDDCLQRFPTVTRPQERVISPSICSRDPEKCMPYACDKVLKDYGKHCSNNNFRIELRKLLQRCNAVSVDLCLINVPYEINV